MIRYNTVFSDDDHQYNDYTGAAPDIAAHEAKTPPMQFGADAYSPAARRREP